MARRLFPKSLTVGLCPGRLVVRDGVRPETELEALAASARLTVVLSSHFVRYAVLPWSDTLRTQEEWLAYAAHAFEATYGSVAAAWKLRLCDAGPRKARVACAVDAELLERLALMRGVVSVQPCLMAAFNARRSLFGEGSAWFVLQEHGRLTACFIDKGEWRLIRNRQANGDWREALPAILDREEIECREAYLCAEEEAPLNLGRYRMNPLHSSPFAPGLH